MLKGAFSAITSLHPRVTNCALQELMHGMKVKIDRKVWMKVIQVDDQQ